ncbi:MAG TPA: hypothetical protein VM841_04915 [Actinomycetota bacterium]|nr:hypothetical protein [Actinomycetota bacterium]
MNGRRLSRIIPALMALALVAAACTSNGESTDQGQQGTQGLLDRIKNRGSVLCGVNNQVPGFGFVDQQGNFSGFDIEFCRVVAAAVLGTRRR